LGVGGDWDSAKISRGVAFPLTVSRRTLSYGPSESYSSRQADNPLATRKGSLATASPGTLTLNNYTKARFPSALCLIAVAD